MPTRRELIALAAPAAVALGLAAAAPAVAQTPNDAEYFTTLQTALKSAGYARPTLVIDRGRLRRNIATMKQALPGELAYRIVVKSLPSPQLIDFIMRETGSSRLMEFHQPFLSDTSQRWPRADILLGKPLPVSSAAAFYAKRRPSAGRDTNQIHWLIDSLERLAQYRAFAAETRRTLSVALEINVGFHRGGFATPQEAAQALGAIKLDPRLTFAGFMGYDAHISIFAQQLGPMEASRDRATAAYEGFLQAARAVDPAYGDPASVILNTGGSTTYPLYRAGRAVTPCNDLAMGSGLLKPIFCDRTLPDHLPAVFIAAPVLKVLDGVQVPGLETDPRGGATDSIERAQTVFLYGGRWMAEPVSPSRLSPHPVYGRSSNQDMFTAPADLRIAKDEFVFFRPTQTEGVLLQFGNIAVVEGGSVVDTWGLLNQV